MRIHKHGTGMARGNGDPMTAQQMKKRLNEIIRTESVKHGDFILASGRRSNYYLDCRRTTLHPEGAFLCGHLILDAIERRGWSPVAVGGLTLGADPLATAASVVSHIEGKPLFAFLVRKEAKAHGTGQQIEGSPAAGSAVVLVEDVITTGGSTLIARDACRNAGLEIQGVVALVDREEGGRHALESNGLAVEALFTARDLL
jgi:orotate phosphoribosyltransferase